MHVQIFLTKVQYFVYKLSWQSEINCTIINANYNLEIEFQNNKDI